VRGGTLTTLADICESVRYGYTASASLDPCGPRFLRITDIVPDSLDWDAVPYCEIDDSERERFALEVGDIVVARTGATVGYAKLIREPEVAVFASYLVRFRVNPAKADPAFVGRLVESRVYKSFVQSRIGGAAQPNASAPVLGSFEFTLPSRHAQIHIADILSAYDDLIENNRRRMTRLEEAARQLYREWFVRLRFPGHEHTRIINGVPEGWRKVSLGEVTSKIGSGFTPRGGESSYLPEGTPLIRSLNVYDDRFEDEGLAFVGEDHAAALAGVTVGSKDILLNITGASVARCCMAPERYLPARVNQHVMIIRVDPEMADPFLVHKAINSDERKRQLLSYAQKGSTREALTKEMIASFEITLPPETLMRQFGEIAAPSFRQREVLALQNQKLRAARDLLLPRLMSGELAV
jgi:type I restriction enzyme S subunit